MKEIKNNTYKGTRILVGNTKRNLVNKCINIIQGFYPTSKEIVLPIIYNYSLFENKVGEENNNMMYTLQDRGKRSLCLAPEYTSVVQNLYNKEYKYEKDVILYYVAECFRGEKPQKGRYRQFTQLGVEILNPTDLKNSLSQIKLLSSKLCNLFGLKLEMKENTERGLNFYKEGKGFEILAPELGSSKQVCGGGVYEGGLGFAIGLDRLLNI